MARDYPADWDARRKRVYRRDNYQCQRCGRRGGPRGDAELHCHHIRPKSTGGSDHPSNLQTLCWRCHNRVHKHHVPRNSSNQSSGREITEKYNRLNYDDYPDAVNDTIEVFNLLVSLFDALENCIKSFDDFATAVINQEEDDEQITALSETLDDDKEAVLHLCTLVQNHPYTIQSGEHNAEIEDVVEQVNEYVDLLSEARTNIATIRENGLTQANYRQYQEILEQMNTTFRDETWVAGDDALSALKKEARSARHTPESQTSTSPTRIKSPGLIALTTWFVLYFLGAIAIIGAGPHWMRIWFPLTIVIGIVYYLWLKRS